MANPLPLDPEILALTNEAAVWLVCAAAAAQCRGLTTPAGIAQLNRVSTGYQDKAARTERAALDFANGFKSAPARETRQDRDMAEAARWGMVA